MRGRRRRHRRRRRDRVLGRRHLQLVRSAHRSSGRSTGCAHRRLASVSFFAGARHPNASVGETAMAARARAPRRRSRPDRYATCSSTIGSPTTSGRTSCSTPTSASARHVDHVETAFSFRTRVLDYLWAGLPTVTTAGRHARGGDRSGRGGDRGRRPRTPDALDGRAASRLLADDALREAAAGAAARRVARRTGGRRCCSRWSTSAPTRSAAPTS